ncbi:hypothetical protein PN498_24830 [Oscillatoria sp. CS-180]|uniref:hypothetical protein n=1 Tax=Oscillatoria sp. CS-180 TaxID=3021720 RepID=UPI0023312E18|nr:hypothetical protein [Oscillatoria sp. CS-180]MDB9529241.1 hypothetical protein [Oscillatoria sp. CS-180]
MTLPSGSEREIEDAKLLLEEYSFDLSGFQAGELVAIWQQRLEMSPSWIRSAVLEALYQGRYKAFSVEQILQGWKRRGHPIRHFNSEFERIVLGPIDPTVSKYAAMTSLRPSELMAPQVNQAPGVPSTETAPTNEKRAATTAAEDSPISSPLNQADELPPDEPHTKTSESEPASKTAAVDVVETSVSEADIPDANASKADIAEIEDKIVPPSANATVQGNSQSFLFNQPEPIQKFVPHLEASGFYDRLQSVFRHSL